MKAKKFSVSLVCFMLAVVLLFCVFACREAPKPPTEREILASGYWYNENKSVCFVFDAATNEVTLYSLNAGTYTYNFGNMIIGSFSDEECTVTFGDDVKYYVLDSNVMTLGEEDLTLDTVNKPVLNTEPMTSAVDITEEAPVAITASGVGLNQKTYFKFTPENSNKYVFSFLVTDQHQRSSVRTDNGNATYLWILDESFKEIASGSNNVTVDLQKNKTYYVITTVSAVSSETMINMLTVAPFTEG